MLGPQNGFLLCMGVLLIVGAVIWKQRGLLYALGTIVTLTFALPVWLKFSVLGIPLGVQTAASVVGLLALLLAAPRQIWSPIVWLDVVIAGLVILQFLSDNWHGMAPVQCGFLAYGEWAIPYVAGRYAVRDANTLEWLALILSGVMIVLGVGGILEMVSGINLWEIVFGNRPVQGFPRTASRFGLHRSYGTTLHPIFFGLLFTTLTPWPLALWKWSKRGPVKNFASVSLISSLGIVSTISRTSVVAMGVMVASIGAIWFRWLRWVAGILLILFASWMLLDFNDVLTLFESMGGEKRHATKLKLDGEDVELSSAAHRVMLLKVFWPALYESGWLGYGSEAVSTLPPKVPHLPADEKTRKRLKYVDNAYVMFGLRFGWPGVVLFTLLLVVAAWTGIRLAGDRSISEITTALTAMTIAMAASMLVVWFSYDMGFEVLWSFGVLGGLASSRAEGR